MWALICEQDTSRLRGRAEKELEEANKRLKELELANKKLSELETANQRLAEMEALLGRKEQMILDLKKLLEDTKIQARYQTKQQSQHMPADPSWIHLGAPDVS